MTRLQIEIVAGIIEEGELPEDVARRESREEAGAAIGALLPIYRYMVSPGGASESVQVYCGRVDSKDLGGIHGLPEENEDIRVEINPDNEEKRFVGVGRYLRHVGYRRGGGRRARLALNRARLREIWR